jgi:hypothetical protein
MDIGREDARDLARDELSKPTYDDEESLLDRALNWIYENVLSGGGSGEGDPVSSAVVAIIVVLVVVAAAIAIIRTGRLARQPSKAKSVFGDDKRGAATYREAAVAAADRGDWHTAVVERFRAIIASAEERGVVDSRPGRTADEAARDTGRHLPELASRLSDGAALFDATLYGDHAADKPSYSALVSLDDDLRAARPSDTESDTSEPHLAVPR